MINYFDMDGNPIADVLEWGAYMDRTRRDGTFRIGLTHLRGFVVSTVYLGLNHRWDDGLPPLIFETMVFFGSEIGGEDAICERYSTKEEARAGHARIVHDIEIGVHDYLLPSVW